MGEQSLARLVAALGDFSDKKPGRCVAGGCGVHQSPEYAEQCRDGASSRLAKSLTLLSARG